MKRVQKSAKLPPQTSSDRFQAIPRPFRATLGLSGVNMAPNQFDPKFWVKFGSNLGQIGQLWGKLPVARHVSSCSQQGEFPGERARFHAEPLFKTLGICMHGCSKVSKLKKRRLRRRIFSPWLRGRNGPQLDTSKPGNATGGTKLGHFGAKLGQIVSNWAELGQIGARGPKRVQKSAKLPPQTSSDWFQTIPRPFGATPGRSGVNMVPNQCAPKFWVKFWSNLGRIGQLWGK